MPPPTRSLFGLGAGRSLRARLVLVLSLTIVPPALLSVAQAWSDYRDERQAIERNLVQLARLVMNDQEQAIAGARQMLTALAAQPTVRSDVVPICMTALRSVTERLFEYDAIAVLSERGTVTCTDSGANLGLDMSGRAWFAALLEGQDFVVSDLLDSSLTGGKSIIAAVPIRDEAGRTVVGAMALALDLAALLTPLRAADLPEGRYVALTDAKGEALGPMSATTPLPAFRAADIVAAAKDKASSTIELRAADGVSHVIAVAPLLNGKLHAVLGEPIEAAFGWARIKLLAGMGAPVAIWLIALATAWLAVDHMVVRWVLYLQRLARVYASGKSSVRPGDLRRAPAELRELAASLDLMMATSNQRNVELKGALDRCETAIKEIHHRVKNNLQIVASLLNLQARKTRDPAQRDAIVGIRSRINALALVHRNLYETNDLEKVEVKGFFDSLGEQLREIADGGSKEVGLSIDAPSAVMPAATAVVIALFVTEAVTNAYRHAFAGRGGGRIAIRLALAADGGAVLTVADDGVGGLGSEQHDAQQGGIGLALMAGFARQLGGTVAFEEDRGTVIRLTVPNLARLQDAGEQRPDAA